MIGALLVVAVLVSVGAVGVVISGGGRARGLASGFDIATTMSAAAVRRRARHTRPSIAVRPWTAVREVGIELARAGRRFLYATVEDVVLVFGIPRSGKTALLANHVCDAPGAVLFTSTRPDLHELVIEHRRAIGPVRVFNPEGIGGIESDARVDLVAGCGQPDEAIMRAGYLLAGSAKGGVSDRAFWEGQAHDALRCLLMAAALDPTGDMWSVLGWAPLNDSRPVTLLRGRGARGWADELQDILDLPERTRGSIYRTLAQALRFMADPALAHAATPPRGEGLDVVEFLRQKGTLEVLGTHREHAPAAPLLAALNGMVFEVAKRMAALQPGGRLDPPLTMVLDEAARVCRTPLNLWTADAGGSGIPIIIGLQGPDQLYDVWGDDAGGTIWTNAAIKVAFGGLQSKRHLEELSLLCGQRKVVRDGRIVREPVLEPDEILHLPDFWVLVLRRNTRAVIARIRPAWERRGRPPVSATTTSTTEWTGPLATVIRLADWRRARTKRSAS